MMMGRRGVMEDALRVFDNLSSVSTAFSVVFVMS